jgi:hypothetical protein
MRISRARRLVSAALGCDPVRTVRGVGYALVPPTLDRRRAVQARNAATSGAAPSRSIETTLSPAAASATDVELQPVQDVAETPVADAQGQAIFRQGVAGGGDHVPLRALEPHGEDGGLGPGLARRIAIVYSGSDGS